MIILIGGAVGAAVGLAAASSQSPVYEANSIVFASTSSILTEDFETLGKSAFATDTVIQPVIDELGLDASVESLLSSDQLEAEAISDSTALNITGRASDPKLAASLANTAAQSFSNAATFSGMGNFNRFDTAAPPQSPRGSPTKLYVFVGGLAGGALMILNLLVLYFFYQPVLSEKDASVAFDADHAFSGRVHMPPRLRSGHDDAANEIDIRPHGLVPAVRRAISGADSEKPIRVCFVSLESLHGRGHRAGAVMDLLARAERGRSRKSNSPDEGEADGGSRVRSLVTVGAQDSQLLLRLKASDVVVAFVSEGASFERVRALGEEVRVAPDVRRRIVVFVRPASWAARRAERGRASPARESAPQRHLRLPG